MFRLTHAVVSICLASCCSLFAQEAEQHPTVPREGSWALQFQVASNLTLTSFQGATISGKHHFSSHSALRLGLTLSGNTIASESTEDAFFADTLTNTYSGTGDQDRLAVVLTSQYILYSSLAGVVHPFFGFGPLISYQYGHSTSETSNSAPGYIPRRSTRVSTEESWGVGLSGVVGVEWFVTQAISLLGEYGLGMQYVKGDYTEETEEFREDRPLRRGTRETGSTGWSIASNNVRFGLTVYL